jgi:hypothetical protein
MEKYLGFAWLVLTITSWISFGVASWTLADDFNSGTLVLTVLWFLMSVILFAIGLRLRKPSSS